MKYFKMFIFLLLIFYTYSSSSLSYCIIENILAKNIILKKCSKNELLFGYLSFNSNKKDLIYVTNDNFGIKIPLNFSEEITNFINNNCVNNKKTLKLKTITNFSKKKKIYLHKIVISCNLRK